MMALIDESKAANAQLDASSSFDFSQATSSNATAPTRIEELRPLTRKDVKEFKASYGWARKFMRRYNLVLRRISGSGRSFKPDTVNTVHEYLKDVRELAHNYSDDEIINFDESSYYMDAVGNYTVSSKGARKTYAQTTGKEKVRLSCLMASTANGKRFPILTVVPRKKQILELDENPNMLIIYETKGKLLITFFN